MPRVPHRALGFRRFTARLDTRDPLVIDLPVPVSPVPAVESLLSPVIDEDVDNDTVQSSTSPDTQPTLSPSPGDRSGSSNGGGSIPTPTAGVLPDIHGTPGSLGTAVLPLSSSSPGYPGSVVPGSSTLPSPSSSPGEQSGLYGTNDAGGGGAVNSPGTSADGSAAIIQVSSGSSVATFSGLSTAYPAAVATGSPSPSQSLQSSGSNSASSSPGSATTLTVSARQLSGGAIAGITIICFFSLLALAILIVRRRSIARRTELRKTWWFAHNASGGSFSSANDANSRGRVGSHATGQASRSRSSSRSSFATNFDQGMMFQFDSPLRLSPDDVPNLPPMAEVRDRRQSSNTMLSNSNGPDAHVHFLPAPTDHISVRPFSPSESFVFPKPPRPPVRNTSDSFYIQESQERSSSRCSTPTLVHLSTPPPDLPPTSPPPSLHGQMSIPAHTLSYSNASSIPSTDPFSDPVTPEFADTVVILRDFTSSLDDELAVRPGDRVRLLRMYDDGWVLAEKLAGLKGERHEQGLIPIDCLYEVGETSPILSKRIGSCSEYESKELIGTAL